MHEKPIVKGEIGELKGELFHYSYKNLEDYFKRFNLYTSLDAKRRLELGKKYSYLSPLRLPLNFFTTTF